MGSEGWAWAGDVTQCCPRGGHDSATGHVGRTSRGVTYSLTVPALFGSCLRPLSLQEDKQGVVILIRLTLLPLIGVAYLWCAHTHTPLRAEGLCAHAVWLRGGVEGEGEGVLVLSLTLARDWLLCCTGRPISVRGFRAALPSRCEEEPVVGLGPWLSCVSR